MVTGVLSPFLFPFCLVNFIEGVRNLMQNHQVWSTRAAKTFDQRTKLDHSVELWIITGIGILGFMSRHATGNQFQLHPFDRFFDGVKIELAFLFAPVVAHELRSIIWPYAARMGLRRKIPKQNMEVLSPRFLNKNSVLLLVANIKTPTFCPSRQLGPANLEVLLRKEVSLCGRKCF
jgi:hypothetical protein